MAALPDWRNTKMITPAEIVEIINRMNPINESKTPESRILFMNFYMGFITGKDFERNKYKTSACGESDWLHLALQIRAMQKVACEKYNAWLIRNDFEPVLIPE